MKAWRFTCGALFVTLLMLFLVAPSLILLPVSFSAGNTLRFPPEGFSLKWWENLFTSPTWTNAAIVSLQLAVIVCILATVLGTLAAFGLVRGRFPGQSLVNGLVLGPMVVPVIVIAVGMFAVFVRWRIAGSPLALIAAHTVLALPFVVVNVGASLRTMDRNLELASLNLGAGPLKTFRYVTLPQIIPGVLAGALFAFIISWDEVVLAIFLTSPAVQTLPVVIWGQVEEVVDPTVAAVATLLTVVSSLLLVVAGYLRRNTVDS
jgi:putative spermidine/putrescine transport system permease protein